MSELTYADLSVTVRRRASEVRSGAEVAEFLRYGLLSAAGVDLETIRMQYVTGEWSTWRHAKSVVTRPSPSTVRRGRARWIPSPPPSRGTRRRAGSPDSRRCGRSEWITEAAGTLNQRTWWPVLHQHSRAAAAGVSRLV